MKKKFLFILLAMTFMAIAAAGCSKEAIKEDEEKLEQEASDFLSKAKTDLENLEQDTKEKLESSDLDPATIKQEAVDELDKLKKTVDSEAGDAKEEALKLIQEAEERIHSSFDK